MDNADRKNDFARKATVEDLERVVRIRKYRHCAAEYEQLAGGANTLPEVRNRYLRIAEYYRELADAEAAESSEFTPLGNAEASIERSD